ncbi:hypothetical protein [Pseudomonas sp. SED1]|uniref:hypothetical protein n=1 Tax=Pseudomonas sp. SED1 TaxID=3056845 RepID=UPI00296FF693|nr:hypothetical protein [Pseudomonas sp. SED1]MDY0832576.1 hypothetical protein [Pseudomonas sp. SED1]
MRKNLGVKYGQFTANNEIPSFRKVGIASKLQLELPRRKLLELVSISKLKITNPQGIDIINIIETYKAPLDRMRPETQLIEKVNAITKSLRFQLNNTIRSIQIIAPQLW